MPLLESEYGCLTTRRRGPKPLSVRAQFAATAWLDGDILWREGRVVWRHGERMIAVGPRELEAVSRALSSLARNEKAARRHCGDFDSWQRNRFEQWEKARHLAPIRAPDLETLVSPTRRRNPAAIERLAQLLCVEATVEELPVSPARALFEAWPLSQIAVQAVMHDESQPLPARALAALVTGATRPLHAFPSQSYLRRAARYGARCGFPAAPALCVALLEKALPEAESCVQRVQNTLESRAPFRFDAPQLLALQRARQDAEMVAAWAEAAASLTDPFPALVFAPVSPKRLDFENERALARSWNELRGHFQASLRDQGAKLALHSEPCDLKTVAALLNHLISAPLRALGTPKIERNRAPRRRERDLPPFESGVKDAIATVLEIIQAVVNAPHPGPLLQLLGEAMQKCNQCPNAENLPPSTWAARWLGYVREQQQNLSPLIRLAQKYGVPATRKALNLNCWRALTRHTHLEPELLNFALEIVAWAPPSATHLLAHFCQFGRYWNGVAGARAGVFPILDALSQAEPAERALWLRELFDGLDYSRRGARCDLPSLAVFLPAMQRAAKAGGDKFPTWALVESALALQSATPEREKTRTIERFDWLAGEMARRWSAVGESTPSWGNIGKLVALADQLAGENETEFRQFIAAGWGAIGWDGEVEWFTVQRGALLAKQLPRFQTTLAENFARCPFRCLELLEKLGPLDRFEAMRAPMGAWHHGEEAVLEDNWLPLGLDAALQSWAIRFSAAKRELQESSQPPASLRKIAAWPQKIAAEIAALQQRADLSPHLAKRLENLKSRLAHPDELRASMLGEMGEAIQNLTLEAELSAAERAVERCYRIRLESLGAPQEVALDADLLNAALFSTDIESNRKWLREIVRHHCEKLDETRADWRLQIAGNARWLGIMSQRGLNQAGWLAAMPQMFTIGNQRIELHLESDPLKVLQMGNYFGTCLSRGGCNAHSSVANAVELNKRVVFARDAQNRVVGRQLLSLSTEGKLLGFRVYLSMAEPHAAKLRDAFGSYARDFAARCGVELADRGEVERLFVADWWDDGTITWHDLDASKSKKSRFSPLLRAPNIPVQF